jgi:hypothetical protein
VTDRRCLTLATRGRVGNGIDCCVALQSRGVRKYRGSMGEAEHAGEAEHPIVIDDRDLIERYVERVIVKPQALEVRLVLKNEALAQTEDPSIDDAARTRSRRRRSRSHGRPQASPP